MEPSNLTDHDLLTRIDERVNLMLTAALKRDTEFENYRRETSERIKKAEDDIESLRISRAQLCAIAATVSFIIAAIVKVFWK